MEKSRPLYLTFAWMSALLLWIGLTGTACAQEYGPDLVKKAEADDAESQYQLSRCFLLGKGVAEDQSEAAKWELKAADQGHGQAQFALGARLMAGLGQDGKRNPLQAAKWLNLAVAAGHPKARGVLRYVQTEMTPEQIAEAKKLAEAWKPVNSQNQATASASGGGTPIAGGKMQNWVSADGRSISAELVRIEGDAVVLKRTDGQVFQVPLNQLSQQSQAAARQSANAPPSQTVPASQAEITTASDGTGSGAKFNIPKGVTVDRNGNLYVSDSFNQTIRKITSAGVVTTLAGMTKASGSADGTGENARFEYPGQIAVDANGNLYVTDLNSTIRKISSAGVVTTLAGKKGVTGSSDGVGNAARFFKPEGVAVDRLGNVYVGDTYNHTIRKISTTGAVTTIAGKAGVRGSENGPGTNATFNSPKGLAVDANGNIYVADYSNQIIRKITSLGVVTTLAGTPGNIVSKDGTGAGAVFEYPAGVAVDAGGNVFVADSTGNVIRKMTPAGAVTTLAGSRGASGSADGKGVNAKFSHPTGVAVDANGNVYVADSVNNTIRKITRDGTVTTFAGKAP
ncbi:MAG: NHL domain-containing protein [Prosthecobacter sp.]